MPEFISFFYHNKIKIHHLWLLHLHKFNELKFEYLMLNILIKFWQRSKNVHEGQNLTRLMHQRFWGHIIAEM